MTQPRPLQRGGVDQRWPADRNVRSIRLTASRDPRQLNWGMLRLKIVLEATGLSHRCHARRTSSRLKKCALRPIKKDGTPMFVIGVNHSSYAARYLFQRPPAPPTAWADVQGLHLTTSASRTGCNDTVHAHHLPTQKKRVDGLRPKTGGCRGQGSRTSSLFTGAAKRLAKVIPALNRQATGHGLPGPTPDVSVVISP